MTGVYPEDIVKQAVSYESLLDFTANRRLTIGDYYPTTYSVSLKNKFDPTIGQGKLEELLKQIMAAYQASFIRSGSSVLNSGTTIVDTYEDYDYTQQLGILQKYLEWVVECADEMYEKEPAFRLNGTGFNDISVQLNNLISNNMTQLNAEITMSALTKDTSRLLTQYQFEIRDLNNQLEKQNARLQKIDELTASYEKNEIIYLSTADSLTKIDGNSSQTYDKLVQERRVVTDLIADIEARISTYSLRMDDLMGKTVGQESEKAESEVAEEKEAEETETENPEETAKGTDEGASDEEVQELTKKEIEEAAAQAEEMNRQLIATLEKNIAALKEKANSIVEQYQGMLEVYNAEKLNEGTVSVSKIRYYTPSVLSGSFIKSVIKTAGPFCLIGVLICFMMIFIVKRRELKKAKN